MIIIGGLKREASALDTVAAARVARQIERVGHGRQQDRIPQEKAVAMTYDTITLSKENSVARITLNRPDAANGMNLTLMQELADAVHACVAEQTFGP